MPYIERIPYTDGFPNHNFQTIHRPSDLTVARKMHAKALLSGLPDDYEIAATLFEKCGHYDEARICQFEAEDLK